MRINTTIGYPIAYSKLSIPELPPDYQHNPSLMKKLTQVKHQKLTCVSAPVDHGKTCALVEFTQTTCKEDACKTAWLTIDNRDTDIRRFWGHLCAAIESMGFVIGKHFPESLSASTLEDFLFNLSNILYETMPEDDACYYLILDDFDSLRNPDIEQRFLQFCEYLPSCFHVILSVDVLPRWMLVQSYQRGLSFLTTEDFILSQEDSVMFLQHMVQREVPDAILQNICLQSAGFIQALKLAKITLMRYGGNWEDFRFDGANRSVRQYFKSQVLLGLPGDLHAFLLEISVLERFNAPLCDAALKCHNSQKFIDEMLKRNLPVIPCDEEEEWYRFNNLFLDFLRNELPQLHMEYIRHICFRASEWFDRHDWYDEAAKYMLLATDFKYIENLTKAICAMSRKEKETHYLLWLCRIKAQEFHKHPLLCMLVTWSYISNARTSEAKDWIRKFSTSEPLGLSESYPDKTTFDFAVDCIEMKLLAMEGYGREAIALCDVLLKNEDSHMPSLLSMIYQSLGESYERIGDMTHAQEAYLKAQACASVDATNHQLIFNAFSYADVAYLQGDLEKAREQCERLLRITPPDFALLNAVRALMGLILLERNEKESACGVIERALNHLTSSRNIDLFLEAKMAKTKYLIAMKNIDDAYETIVEAILESERRDVPRAMLLKAYELQAKIAGQRNNLVDLELIERKFSDRVNKNDVCSLLRLKLVRALIQKGNGNYDNARVLFEEIVTEARARNYGRILFSSLLELMLLNKRIGRNTHAHTLLSEALVLACRQGYIRSVLDAGEPLRVMLVELISNRKTGNALKSYAKKLLLEFEKEPAEQKSHNNETEQPLLKGALSELSAREAEVYNLLNMGMSRLETSEILTISINTTKKHITSIYTKLGVASREEALRVQC